MALRLKTLDSTLKIPRWPRAIKTIIFPKMFTILHTSWVRKPELPNEWYNSNQLKKEGKSHQWWICPNQHHPVVPLSHGNWSCCLNLAFRGRWLAVIIWSFWEMRSPDNLAKYAAGGRDRMAVAAGRDHFSPTNQPTSGNVCKNFS